MQYAPVMLAAEPVNGLTSGIDWARDDHAVVIVDHRGCEVHRCVVEHNAAGLRELVAVLARTGVSEVAIERPDGPVIVRAESGEHEATMPAAPATGGEDAAVSPETVGTAAGGAAVGAETAGTAARGAAPALRRRRIIMAVIVVLILIIAVVILVVMKPFTIYSPPNGAVLGAITIWFSPAGRVPRV